MADDATFNATVETVQDGHDEPWGDRLPSLDPSPASVPSAPPRTPKLQKNLGKLVSSGPDAAVCVTTLCHTAPRKPSKKRSETTTSPAAACDTRLRHKPSPRHSEPSGRSPPHRRRQSSGIMVRGTVS